MERRNNPWWDFVKENRNKVKHLTTRKEQFELLSELWKNKKSHVITIQSEYLEELHNNNHSLKIEVNKLQDENKKLKNLLEILQMQLEN